jgi:hypothetical protein
MPKLALIDFGMGIGAIGLQASIPQDVKCLCVETLRLANSVGGSASRFPEFAAFKAALARLSTQPTGTVRDLYNSYGNQARQCVGACPATILAYIERIAQEAGNEVQITESAIATIVQR